MGEANEDGAKCVKKAPSQACQGAGRKERSQKKA
jgi:hypothetical protein